MSDKPKHFKTFLIALSALTIIELFMLISILVFNDNRIILIAAFFLLVPSVFYGYTLYVLSLDAL